MKSTKNGFKVIVFGAGKMGQRYLTMLSKHPAINHIGLYDPLQLIPTPSFVQRIVASELEHRLSEFDIAIVACSTSQHFEVTLKLIEHGLPCLVEKPLVETNDEHEQIAKFSRDKGTLVTVGFIERFNPALIAAKDILRSHHWDRILFSRMNPASARLASDSVVHDLMIHDIDLVLNVFGEKCTSIQQVNAASLRGTTIDYVTLKYITTSDLHIELCCSRLPGPTVRQIEASGPDGILLIDLLRKRFHFIPSTRGVAVLGGVDTIHTDPLLDQFQEFLQSACGNSTQIATAQDTGSVQALAEKINNSAHQSIKDALSNSTARQKLIGC